MFWNISASTSPRLPSRFDSFHRFSVGIRPDLTHLILKEFLHIRQQSSYYRSRGGIQNSIASVQAFVSWLRRLLCRSRPDKRACKQDNDYFAPKLWNRILNSVRFLATKHLNSEKPCTCQILIYFNILLFFSCHLRYYVHLCVSVELTLNFVFLLDKDLGWLVKKRQRKNGKCASCSPRTVVSIMF